MQASRVCAKRPHISGDSPAPWEEVQPGGPGNGKRPKTTDCGEGPTPALPQVQECTGLPRPHKDFSIDTLLSEPALGLNQPQDQNMQMQVRRSSMASLPVPLHRPWAPKATEAGLQLQQGSSCPDLGTLAEGLSSLDHTDLETQCQPALAPQGIPEPQDLQQGTCQLQESLQDSPENLGAHQGACHLQPLQAGIYGLQDSPEDTEDLLGCVIVIVLPQDVQQEAGGSQDTQRESHQLDTDHLYCLREEPRPVALPSQQQQTYEPHSHQPLPQFWRSQGSALPTALPDSASRHSLAGPCSWAPSPHPHTGPSEPSFSLCSHLAGLLPTSALRPLPPSPPPSPGSPAYPKYRMGPHPKARRCLFPQ